MEATIMSRPIFVKLKEDNNKQRIYRIEAAGYNGTATIIKSSHTVEYEGEAPDYIMNHWKCKSFLDKLILSPFEHDENPEEYTYA